MCVTPAAGVVFSVFTVARPGNGWPACTFIHVSFALFSFVESSSSRSPSAPATVPFTVMTLPRVWMTTPSSATGAADPLAAGVAVDALAIGAADADAAGALDVDGAEPADEGVSGFASLFPHASSTPNITHAIVFVMRASYQRRMGSGAVRTMRVALHALHVKSAWHVFAPLPVQPVVIVSPGVQERLAVSAQS